MREAWTGGVVVGSGRARKGGTSEPHGGRTKGACPVAGGRSGAHTRHTSSPLQLHFRRCAPESLRHGAFSSASDVWMFGVTLWEMFSGGEEPWAGVPPYLILQRLEKDRARLRRPPLCSRALYALALRCWAPHPADRPTFSYLEGLLQEVGTLASPETVSFPSVPSPRVLCTRLTYTGSRAGVWDLALNKADPVPTFRVLRAPGRELGSSGCRLKGWGLGQREGSPEPRAVGCSGCLTGRGKVQRGRGKYGD